MAVPISDAVLQQCWKRAIHAFGTAGLFERQAAALKRKTQVLTFAGLALPLLVGGVVRAFGVTSWLGTFIGVVSGIAVLQGMVSLWSLVSGWNASLSYARESAADNHKLAEEYQRLITAQPKDFANQLDRLELNYAHRNAADIKHGVSPEDKRLGLRIGLHRFQKECVDCKLVPAPDAPTSCSVCGK